MIASAIKLISDLKALKFVKTNRRFKPFTDRMVICCLLNTVSTKYLYNIFVKTRKFVWSISQTFSQIAQCDLAKDRLAQTESLTARHAALRCYEYNPRISRTFFDNRKLRN